MHPVLRRFVLPGILLCSIPAAAAAMESLVWNFERGHLPTTWDSRRLTNPHTGTQGFVIQTDAEGFMTTPADFPTTVDAIRLTVDTKHSMEMAFLWRKPKVAGEHYIQLPFFVYGQEGFQTIEIDLSQVKFWNERTDVIGFAFPKGADITIREIEFLHWSMTEKIAEGFRAFWKFDTFKVHSINFLWGPLLTFNPIARAQMYAVNPPLGRSGMWAFYAVLGLAGAGCFAWRRRLRRMSATALFLLVFVGAWVFYDIRMSSEILKYVHTDWQSYVLEEMEGRLLRSQQNFHDIAMYMATRVQNKYPTYRFYGPDHESIYLGMIRYYTFPSLPLLPGDAPVEEEMLALIYRREDITLNAQKRLVRNGELLFEHDTLLQQFDPHSFLVRLTP